MGVHVRAYMHVGVRVGECVCVCVCVGLLAMQGNHFIGQRTHWDICREAQSVL